MPKLPVISGKDMIRELEKDGFLIVRQKGSHVSLQKGIHKTVVPIHDELAKGTLLGILKLTKEALIALLNE
jgi:predicted RNA binding protein YcfA (HicA-like mRNA interferase family)